VLIKAGEPVKSYTRTSRRCNARLGLLLLMGCISCAFNKRFGLTWTQQTHSDSSGSFSQMTLKVCARGFQSLWNGWRGLLSVNVDHYQGNVFENDLQLWHKTVVQFLNHCRSCIEFAHNSHRNGARLFIWIAEGATDCALFGEEIDLIY